MSDQPKEEAESTSTPTLSEGESSEGQPTEIEASGADGAESDLAEEEAGGEDAPRNRRERRALQAGKNDQEDVKDRNRRLRAEAAAQRRERRERERDAAQVEGLATGERVDDALIRTAHATSKFVGSNFKWLQWVIVGGVALGMGSLIYGYMKKSGREASGESVGVALQMLSGAVLDAEDVARKDANFFEDTRPEFASPEQKWAEVQSAWQNVAGEETASLKLIGALGEAGALYAEGKYKEAKAAYEGVLNTPASTALPTLRLRAQEGVGLAAEALRDYQAADAAFSALSNSQDAYLSDLGKFHQARVLVLQDKNDDAKAILLELDKKLNKDAGFRGPEDYLGASVSDLLKRVDPSQINRTPQFDPELLRRLQEQMSQGQPG